MSDVVTVSGSSAYSGPLPMVREVAEDRGLTVTSVVFDGDAADEYTACRETVRTRVEEDAPAVVAGFSAGAHLALDLVQAAPSLFPADAVVLAFDPPAVMQIDGGTSEVSPVEPVEPGVAAIYPSVRDPGDRVDGACRVREVQYEEFQYSDDAPSDEEYSRMDRAHRFKDRDAAVRRIVEDEVDWVSPHQVTDGTPAHPGQ
ncbi:MAG: hypothetical protein ABEI97_01165 [Candidatus Nanohaloarchaea archaeon]